MPVNKISFFSKDIMSYMETDEDKLLPHQHTHPLTPPHYSKNENKPYYFKCSACKTPDG